MVLQALAHAGQVVCQGHALGGEQSSITHPRELQKLGRVDGAAAQNHFFAAFELLLNAAHHAFHAHGLAPLQQHALNQRMGEHRQIAAAHGRAQKGVGRRGAHALANRHLPQAKAFFARAIEVGGTAIAQRLTGLQKTFAQRMHLVGKVAHC